MTSAKPKPTTRGTLNFPPHRHLQSVASKAYMHSDPRSLATPCPSTTPPSPRAPLELHLAASSHRLPAQTSYSNYLCSSSGRAESTGAADPLFLVVFLIQRDALPNRDQAHGRHPKHLDIGILKPELKTIKT